MKALTLRNPSLTKEILLRKADETPGAWIGIRIAGLLLILSGWKSTQVRRIVRFNPLGGGKVDPESEF
jgi:hypothetical protein